MQGTEDVCAVSSKAPGKAKALMKTLGVPDSCPVQEGQVCAGDESFDISQYKSMLGFAKGQIEAEISATHDTGNSCYKVILEISK